MTDRICFSYKLDENAEIKLKEYFIPYSFEFLKENLNIEEKYLSLFNKSSFDLEILKKCIDEASQLKDFISIKSFNEEDDSSWVANGDTVFENSLFDYYADLKFVSVLVNDKTYWTVRIGIATEIMKKVMDIFKINISILLRLKDFTNENTIEFIEKNVLPKTFLGKEIKNPTEDLRSQGVPFLIKQSCSQVSKYLAYISSSEINDNCLQQLAEYFDKNLNLELRSKFVTNRSDDKNKGCFCIINNQEKYYFSFSGEDFKGSKHFKKYESLAKKIENYLKKNILKSELVYWKNIGLNTKSYGFYIYSEENKSCIFDSKFMLYPFPLRYACERDLQQSENEAIGNAYSCCERKIFASIIDESCCMQVYCRWSPCEKCFPAVVEQIKLHSHFEFWAFAKDFDSFKKKSMQ